MSHTQRFEQTSQLDIDVGLQHVCILCRDDGVLGESALCRALAMSVLIQMLTYVRLVVKTLVAFPTVEMVLAADSYTWLVL